MAGELYELRKFVAPEFVFGPGARKLAGQYAQNLGMTNVLLVSDSGVDRSGWTGEVARSLEEQNIQYSIFLDVSPNPRDFECMLGADLYHKQKCNGIISVGGGSPMDCAKAIGIVVTNHQHITQFEGIDRVFKPVPPLIFIPTTSGSAAEVSQFAIITNTTSRVKMAIVSKAIVPDLALIDPETLTTMDSYLMACTGVDALVHSFEAYVSNASSAITDLHAVESVNLISQYLPKALEHPGDMHFLSQIMHASLMAGLAFSNAILGAVHAMSHSLGGYLDLPHGECNAILLPHVVRFNYPEAVEKYNRLCQIMTRSKSLSVNRFQLSDLSQCINDFKEAVRITKNLTQAGMTKPDIPILAEKAIRDACMVTNPRAATQKDIEAIFEEAQ